jgi:hypothetical protein
VDGMTQVRRRRRRQVATTLVAGLAVVAVVGVAVPLIVSGGDRGESASPAASAPSPALVGVRWRMVSVADGETVTAVPASVGASLELTPGGRMGPSDDGVDYDGSIGLNDGTNYSSGRYDLTEDGFKTGWIAQTLALYGGHDPHHLAAIKAVNAIAFGLTPDHAGSEGARTTVVSMSPTSLVVTAQGLRVTFERDGSGA